MFEVLFVCFLWVLFFFFFYIIIFLFPLCHQKCRNENEEIKAKNQMLYL